MKVTQSREEILAGLRKKVEKKIPILGAGAGTGLSAKCEEIGGVDLIVIYNSGRFRMAGRGSLSGMMPYGDANNIVLDMAKEVLTVVESIPILAGVCGTDPFRDMDKFLREIRSLGFAGVQNFPTVGLCDGLFRENLEETGMSYDLEVDMIRKARQMNLLTSPYVFNESEARKMAAADADIIVAHMGLTTKGSIGARTSMSLDEAARRIQLIADAAKEVNQNVIVLCHGGPLSEPEDVRFILSQTSGVHGFYGASSMERLPTELAIVEQVRRFSFIQME